MSLDAAAVAGALLAVDPVGLGGACLRGPYGPEREAWLEGLREALPERAPYRRLPPQVPDARLLGGLDLVATLNAGRLVQARGLLAECDGGALVIPMAERLLPAVCGHLAAVLDRGVVDVERDGVAASHAARFVVVALDEGAADEDRPPASLLDRLAFDVDATRLPDEGSPFDRPRIAAARERLPRVATPDEALAALCESAVLLGVDSLRPVLFAMRAARAHAALKARDTVDREDLEVAAKLVLGPRATRLPAEESAESREPPPPSDDASGPDRESVQALEDRVLEAARAALPEGLLVGATTSSRHANAARQGRSGEALRNGVRGRRQGAKAGLPRRGARVDLVETLRAAAPWQPLRRKADPRSRKVIVRAEDLRITKYESHRRSTAIFVVDASGSAALHRLAEAKGAVLLMLADCYVRRDEVALVAFRGRGAELLLPPTRSLVRARKCLTALPGGGGTPLAAGLDAAFAAAEGVRRSGASPLVVLLTDGRANVARDGSADRVAADLEARQAGRAFLSHGVPAVVVDVSPQPREEARGIAAAMGARYAPLPRAGAADIACTVGLEISRHRTADARP